MVKKNLIGIIAITFVVFFATLNVKALDCSGYDSVNCKSQSGCKWSASEEKCVVSHKVSCGQVTDIPEKIPELTSFFLSAAEVITIVALVIVGMIDLFKGIYTQKEEEIKKGQQLFVKKLIIAALVFFIVVIVKFFIGIISDASKGNVIECVDCFISNDCK